MSSPKELQKMLNALLKQAAEVQKQLTVRKGGDTDKEDDGNSDKDEDNKDTKIAICPKFNLNWQPTGTNLGKILGITTSEKGVFWLNEKWPELCHTSDPDWLYCLVIWKILKSLSKRAHKDTRRTGSSKKPKKDKASTSELLLKFGQDPELQPQSEPKSKSRPNQQVQPQEQPQSPPKSKSQPLSPPSPDPQCCNLHRIGQLF
ncbi:hypothetical protein B0J17DRAFT_720581 [Rhizoctonia solani]|nr:hypothetical protein B0J17DRAFT_720581 [Rhizoctonia solani]